MTAGPTRQDERDERRRCAGGDRDRGEGEAQADEPGDARSGCVGRLVGRARGHRPLRLRRGWLRRWCPRSSSSSSLRVGAAHRVAAVRRASTGNVARGSAIGAVPRRMAGTSPARTAVSLGGGSPRRRASRRRPGCRSTRLPPIAATRSSRPRRPLPPAGSAPPTPSSATTTRSDVGSALRGHGGAGSLTRTWPRWPAPPRRRNRPSPRPARGSRRSGRAVTSTRHRRALGQRIDGRAEARLGQDRRMDPARELAQLDERGLEFVGGGLQAGDGLRVGVRSEPRARHAGAPGRSRSGAAGRRRGGPARGGAAPRRSPRRSGRATGEAPPGPRAAR